MKIVTIIGARPQFIKAASLSLLIKEYDNINEIIIHTGQHFDENMSEIFFKELNIPKPNYNLNIGGLSHGKMTGEMICKIEEILFIEKPDWVLVYGDTNSTLAGAIAASKLNIKIAHIEAGLRSFNMLMPEEQNRIVTDNLSNYLFCPTLTAYDNLEKEGFKTIKKDKRISIVGDILEDSSLLFKKYSFPPNDFNLKGNFILTTIHRAENTDSTSNLIGIFDSLRELSKDYSIVIPLHPRTKSYISKYEINTDGLYLIPPQGYLNMLWLIENSNLIITDSGGLQKEAFFFNKFCVTLRGETEWIELVQFNYNILAGSNKNLIVESVKKFINKKFVKKHDFYGGGNSGLKIINELNSV